MSLSDALRRRLRAAADAFLDPSVVEADTLGWEEPDEGEATKEPAATPDAGPVVPEPVDGMRNLVVVVLDSCRYDTCTG